MVQFQQNIRNLMVGRGMLPVFSSSGSSAITIFSGAQPSANTLISEWDTIKANTLLSWGAVTHIQSGANSPGTGIFTMGAAPAATANLSTGTATWGVIWATNSATTASSALPTALFIVVPVSDTLGSGVIKLATTNITSGNYTISSFTINIT